jgi:hypothetical protein
MCVRKEKVQEKFVGVSHTLRFRMPGTKNPSILSSHSQKTKEQEQPNKTANFKCNSGSQTTHASQPHE